MIQSEEEFDMNQCENTFKYGEFRDHSQSLPSDLKGELVGPGNFGNQDTLVANTQAGAQPGFF